MMYLDVAVPIGAYAVGIGIFAVGVLVLTACVYAVVIFAVYIGNECKNRKENIIAQKDKDGAEEK